MVWIKGRYSTNHPKDRAAKKRKELGDDMRANFCSKRELQDPSERNVQKCMHDMQSKKGDEWKKVSKFLGEQTNWEKNRRR